MKYEPWMKNYFWCFMECVGVCLFVVYFCLSNINFDCQKLILNTKETDSLEESKIDEELCTWLKGSQWGEIISEGAFYFLCVCIFTWYFLQFKVLRACNRQFKVGSIWFSSRQRWLDLVKKRSSDKILLISEKKNLYKKGFINHIIVMLLLIFIL